MRRLKAVDLAGLLVIAAAFLYCFRAVPSHQPFTYDESDYMDAGERGFADNFLETPSNSIIGFYRIGKEHASLDKRSSLSDLIRGSRDITFYRHFHGPIYFYWIALVSPLVHHAEYAMRFSGFAFHLLTFFTIAIGVFFFTGFRSAALLAGSLYLFGQSSIETSAMVTPHIPYVFFTTATLLCFAGFLFTGQLRLWYLAVAAFTGAFCSIDYAILLPITFAVCLAVFRNQCKLSMVTLVRAVLLFLALLLVLWPIGLLQFSAVKGYFYIAYLAMQRKGSYGEFGPLTIWFQRFTAAPVEYVLDLIALVGSVALWKVPAIRKYRAVLLPCIVYAFLMLLTTLKNTSLNPTYVSSILPPLAIVTGIAFAAFMERTAPAVRNSLAAILVLATIGGGWQLLARLSPEAPNSDAQTIAALRTAGLQQSTLLVPYEILPTLSYYFPRMRLHPFLVTDNAQAVQEKMRDFDTQALLLRPRPNDHLPEQLDLNPHIRKVTVGDPARTGLYLLK